MRDWLQRISIDVETTGLNAWHGDLPFSISICDKREKPLHIRWAVNPFTRKAKYEKGDLKYLRKIAEDPYYIKIFHNAPFDYRMLYMMDIHLKGRIEDTLFMIQVLRSHEPSKKLKDLAVKYCGISKEDETDLHKAAVKARRLARKKEWWIKYPDEVETDYWMAPENLNEKYNNLDTIRTINLDSLLEPKLNAEEVREVYERELKLFPVVAKMEERGVRIHPAIIDSETLKVKKIGEKKKKIINKWFPGINVNSSKQMLAVLYGDGKYKGKKCLGMPVIRKTEKNNPSADGEALRLMDHPFPVAVIEYKTCLKTVSSFFDVYRQYMIRIKKGLYVLKANFKQGGAVTGRFSIVRPALQTVRSEDSGKAISEETEISARAPFGPRDGYIWITPDYKGEEVWIAAYHAKCKADIKALLAGEDVHDVTTRDIFHIKPSHKLWGSFRKRSKNVRFGVGYGAQAKKMAFLIRDTVQKAQEAIDGFFSSRPEYRVYMKRMINRAQRDGFIWTPFGRKIQCWNYEAFNYDIQGTAADIIKIAMILLDKFFLQKKLDAHLLLTIHDELIIEIKREEATDEVIQEIVRIMQKPSERAGIPQPLPVTVKWTDTYWTEKKDWTKGGLDA